MKGCEHMIRRGHDLHEVFLHNCLMFYQCHGHIFEYDSLGFQFFPETMVDDLTVILCTHSCEYFPFCLRDTESVKCIFYRLRHIIP